MGGIPKGSVVYKCGSTTYKTSGCVTNINYNNTMEGVALKNLVKVEKKFCDYGDSGGIVYTYANNEYVPCGIISARPGKEKPNEYGVFVKASEIAYYLNVQPY